MNLKEMNQLEHDLLKARLLIADLKHINQPHDRKPSKENKKHWYWRIQKLFSHTVIKVTENCIFVRTGDNISDAILVPQDFDLDKFKEEIANVRSRTIDFLIQELESLYQKKFEKAPKLVREALE